MSDQRNNVHRGFEMTSGVEGNAARGFYVAVQWMRLTTQGTHANVPIDGIASGRFESLDGAFSASFARISEAIDRHIDGK